MNDRKTYLGKHNEPKEQIMGDVTTILILLTAIFAISALKSCLIGEKLLMLIFSILTIIFLTFSIRVQIYGRKKDHRRKEHDQ